ncbi:MAG TPA: DUF1028 domain-containing protein [Acidobacteriota bacterium]|nr:DUF1028 domain-containing protein [Acidobacteriota bacterium]
MRYFCLTTLTAASCLAAASTAAASNNSDASRITPRIPTHTYSIVARDSDSGEFGVAVQTHWFAVGQRVAWAEAGVGAVATQSFTDPSYGYLGLDLMRAGRSAPEVLEALVSMDSGRELRQVGMIDRAGQTASHTGSRAIRERCHHAGNGFSVQANLMENSTVCTAMAKAYQNAQGDLAERLLAALEAAQKEGGDIRGQQSAALLVVAGERSEAPWGGRIFDLRVDDHKAPLSELARLLNAARSYRLYGEADRHWAAGRQEEALQAFEAAQDLAPDNHELVFWHAVTLAEAGRVREALPLFAKAFSMWPKWRTVVQRLPASGLLPDDPELIERILTGQ